MIREITGYDGVLTCELPQGEYALEVSKGSEYSVEEGMLTIRAGEESAAAYRLERLIDLPQEGFYGGDLHHHSVYSSPVWGGTDPVTETPEEVCLSMQAMGLAFGALSDHHNVLNHDVWRGCTENGFIPIVSKEISTSNGHVLALGVEDDVIYRIPEPKDRTDAYLRGEFIRVTDEIKRKGGVAQLNHPRDLSRSISWNPAYEDIIDIFDTMEIWNGSHLMKEGTTNAAAAELWLRLLEEGRYIPATTGSDTHNIRANDYHALVDRMTALSAQLTKADAASDRRIACFAAICTDELALMEKWAETNLTSGGVRTYVYVPEKANAEQILGALCRGNSFLTDGPILIPRIGGALPGMTSAGGEVEIKLISNRPLGEVCLYTDGGRRTKKKLEAVERKRGGDDYSFIWKDAPVKDAQWAFFTAADDCTQLAISNPIFLKRE